MIYIERTITIKKNQARIEQPIVLYKGDRNIELQFIIENNPFKYKAGTDVTYGQLVIKRPKAAPIFSEPAKMSSSKVLFIVTGDMIDELDELGNYDFQIRLLNTDQSSRGSLPEVTGGIIIKEPLCEEATVNATSVNDSNAYVMRANNTVMLALDDSDGIFDEEGNYNRTNWHGGDIITDVRLNRVEEALYQINDDIPTDYVTEEYVNDKDRNTRNYVADNYTTKVYVDQAIGNIDVDLTGYATEEYVDDAIRNIDIPEVDLDDYATESYVNEVMPDIIEIGNEDGSVYNFTGLEFTDEEYSNRVCKNIILKNVAVRGYSEAHGVTRQESYDNELVYIKLALGRDNIRIFIIYSPCGEVATFYLTEDNTLMFMENYSYITSKNNNYATKSYVDDAIANIDVGGNDLPIRVIGSDNPDEPYIFTGDEFAYEEYENDWCGSVFIKGNVSINYTNENSFPGGRYFNNELVYMCIWLDGDNKVFDIKDQYGYYDEYTVSPDGVITNTYTETSVSDSDLENYATKEELQAALGNIEDLLGGI